MEGDPVTKNNCKSLFRKKGAQSMIRYSGKSLFLEILEGEIPLGIILEHFKFRGRQNYTCASEGVVGLHCSFSSLINYTLF